MSKIKDKILNDGDVLNGKTFSLTDFEFKYINSLMVNTEVVKRQNNISASAFLSYVAGGRLGYEEGKNLQFALDEKGQQVTITVLPDDEA